MTVLVKTVISEAISMHITKMSIEGKPYQPSGEEVKRAQEIADAIQSKRANEAMGWEQMNASIRREEDHKRKEEESYWEKMWESKELPKFIVETSETSVSTHHYRDKWSVVWKNGKFYKAYNRRGYNNDHQEETPIEIADDSLWELKTAQQGGDWSNHATRKSLILHNREDSKEIFMFSDMRDIRSDDEDKDLCMEISLSDENYFNILLDKIKNGCSYAEIEQIIKERDQSNNERILTRQKEIEEERRIEEEHRNKHSKHKPPRSNLGGLCFECCLLYDSCFSRLFHLMWIMHRAYFTAASFRYRNSPLHHQATA